MEAAIQTDGADSKPKDTQRTPNQHSNRDTKVLHRQVIAAEGADLGTAEAKRQREREDAARRQPALDAG